MNVLDSAVGRADHSLIVLSVHLDCYDWMLSLDSHDQFIFFSPLAVIGREYFSFVFICFICCMLNSLFVFVSDNRSLRAGNNHNV